ncbi:MAG: TolC family protein [Gammaproteobacteria bacterium]|nr:TolC family protein [Gammaproteobacteria bacterium]
MRQRMLKVFPLSAAVLFVSACASYQPLPLNDQPHLPEDVAHLRVDPRDLSFPHLATYKIDAADGLDMTEVAILAVLNNPELKLARADANIAHAQAFAAGLLPDPQFNLSRDFPRQSGPGITNAYNAGIAYDINTLITHAAQSDAALADVKKADLNLLWQEWQVIAKARMLFAQAYTQTRLVHWLMQNRDLLAIQYQKSKQALAQGNLTAEAADSALIAWQDAERQLNDLQRQQAQTRQDLNALLGLAPSATLQLVDNTQLASLADSAVQQALQDLPQRRPDLLALKAGYAAQDARYRQAILAQFPAFNLGITRAQDTAGLVTNGFTLALTLPLFNANRGNIKIEEATRQRLHDEYEIRLNAARADVLRLLADRRLIHEQLNSLDKHLPALDQAADRARTALASGAIDTAGYVSFESVRIAKHIEAANLQQALLENQISLLIFVGGDFHTHVSGNVK